MAYDVDYVLLEQQVRSLSDGQPHWLAALSNVTAQLWETLPDINWVGFYLRASVVDARLDGNELILGPFHGRVACTRIAWNRGVCGTAAATDSSQRVADVHAFPGHIACDAASASELVVPLHAGGEVVGVLDIDSPRLARFDERDEQGMGAVARAVEQAFTHYA